MKRTMHLCALMLSLFFWFGARSQTAEYAFSHEIGTYVPNSSNATLVASVQSNTTILSRTLPIGFPFVYAGGTYTEFKMSSEGYITLDTSQGAANVTNNLSGANTSVFYRPFIAPFWDDVNGGVGLASYEVTGTAPNRVLTVEWLEWRWTSNATVTTVGPHISFQVKLYETTNVIEFVYRHEREALVGTRSTSIGINDPLGSGNGTYLNLNTNLLNPTATSTANVTTINTRPENNQVFRFTPPSCTYNYPVTVTGITATSATINLSSPPTAPIEVYIITNGAPPAVGTPATHNISVGQTTLPLTNLNPSKKYKVYFKYNCPTRTGWSLAAEFGTLCATITTNFYEGFDYNGPGSTTGYPNNLANVPYCWTHINTVPASAYGYTASGQGANGTPFGFYFYRYSFNGSNPGDLLVVSPPTDNLGNGTKQVRFFAKLGSTGSTGGKVSVYSMDNNTATANKTVLATVDIPLGTTTWHEFKVPLPATTDDYFALSMDQEEGNKYVVIDEIYYEDMDPCMFPLGVSISNVTTTGATVSWSPSVDPNVTEYEYEVRDLSGAVIDSGRTSGTSTPVSGLNPSSIYRVYVRSICGTAEGDWGYPATLNTACDVMSSNFYESFDFAPSGASNNNTVPHCWTYASNVASSGYGYTTSSAGRSGQGFYTYRYNAFSGTAPHPSYQGDLLLISPQTNNLGNGTKQVRFWARSGGTGYSGTFEVYTIDSPSVNGSKTLVATIVSNGQLPTTWTEYIVPLPATTDDYFAFSFQNDQTVTMASLIYVDDIYYEDVLPCMYPMNVAVSNITTTSADITWNASTTTGLTEYEYEIRTAGAPGTPGAVDSGRTTNTFHNSTVLTAGTKYFVYVRSVCGITEGDWTKSVEFTTLCNPFLNNFYEDFNSTPVGSTVIASPPTCWAYINTVPANTYAYTTSGGRTGNRFYFYRYSYQGSNPGDLLLVSPMTNNLGNGTKQVRFYARTSSAGSSFSVYTMDGNTAAANKTLVTSVKIPVASQWIEYVVPLPVTTDDFFAIGKNFEEGNTYLELDDIYYEDLEPCMFPMGGGTVSNITLTGAIVSWNPSTDPGVTGYEYEVRTSGSPGTGGSGLVTSGTVPGPSVDLSGLLSPSSTYIVYVRSVCSSVPGRWNPSPMVEFATLCGLMTGNFYEGFEGAPMGSTSNNTVPACWTYLWTGPASTSYGYVGTINPAAGTSRSWRGYRANGPGDLLLVSPETVNLGNGRKRLRFHLGSNTGGAVSNIVSVYTMRGNTAGDAATKTLVATIDLGTSGTTREFIVNLPATTDDYFAFSWDQAQYGNYTHIDEIYYEDAPFCMEISNRNITVSDIKKDGFTVNWQDLVNSGVAYEVEVRDDNGVAGTPGAAYSTITPIGATSVNVSGLNPYTRYSIHIRAICSAAESSIWSPGLPVVTSCDFPNIISHTPMMVYCGPQPAHLEVELDDASGTAAWYDNEDDIEPIFEGTDFISETDVTESRSFWVRSKKINLDTPVGVGEEGDAHAANMQLFLHSYRGLKNQYIFTATELDAAGIKAGEIKGLQFDVVFAGTRTREDFTISMGHTTQNVATTTLIDNSALQEVYNDVRQRFDVGFNTFTFSTPFVWDGVSNVVIQTNWVNEVSALAGEIRHHTAPAVRTSLIYTTDVTITASMLLAQTGSSGAVPYMYASTGTLRPNTYFIVDTDCESEAIEIPVIIEPKPAFELSSYKIASCEGETTEVVTIETNVGGYDTFVWTPSTGVSGDHINGWTFTTPQEQEYVLVASQSNGICEHVKTVHVYSSKKPVANPNLATTHSVCINKITELRVLDELPADIVVGPGTATTAPHLPVSPFVQSGKYSKQQYIYSANDLIAQGADVAGFITGLSFNTINSGASMNNANYRIRMMLISDTSFPDNNFYAGNFATVYSTSVHTHTFQGWQSIDFDSPFYWDGQSNILIEITQEGMGIGNNNAQTYFTAIGTEVGMYATSETETNPVTGIRTVNRMNTRFSFEQSSVTWSPATNLYIDATATIPYVAGQNAGTVYTTSSTALSQVYNVLITAPNGCTVQETYTVNTISIGTPVVQDQTFCNAVPVTNIIVTGHQGAALNFYNSSTSTAPISNISQSGRYYVEVGQGDCKSVRVPFNITIVTLPNPTVQFTQVICGSGTIADLKATATGGAQIQWYSSATSTTPLASTQALVNNTTYYAAQTMSGCVSGRVAVLVNVNSAPAALTAQTINICGNLTYDGANLNQLGGAELVWYQSPTSQQPIPGTGQIVSGTYYVSQKVNGCESPRTQIIVTAQSGTVPAPTAATQNICGGGTVADLVAQTTTGGVAVWYNSSTSTTPLQSTDVLSSGTYYVAQQIGNCLSTKTAVSVRVINTTMPSVAPFNLCEGATVADLILPTPSGTTYKWYLNSTSTVPLNPTDVLSSGFYFVVRDQSGCESARIQVQVTINTRPSSPTGDTQQSFVDYAEIGELIMDQPNVVWYLTYEDAMNGVNPLPANMPLVHETTYYAVIIGSNGCPSLPTAVEVTITLGVNDFDLSQLEYYPNPTTDIVTISYIEVIKKVEVFDLSGRLVISKDFDSEVVKLDLGKLSSATYILNIKTQDSSQFVKIVKK